LTPASVGWVGVSLQPTVSLKNGGLEGSVPTHPTLLMWWSVPYFLSFWRLLLSKVQALTNNVQWKQVSEISVICLSDLSKGEQSDGHSE